MGAPFRHRLRVRWSDCDPQGVVFYPNYLAFVDLGITELWRSAIRPYQEMIAQGADMVVAETTMRYLEPARFDDEIELAVTVERLGTTSLSTTTEIERVSDGATLARCDLRHVFVDPATLRKREIPDDVRAALAELAPPAG